MKNIVIIPLLKIFSYITQKLGIGSGSTWPGHVALKLDSKFVVNLLKNSEISVILVVGTNGKTTTSSMISHLLSQRDKKVLLNQEGANLLNGVASVLVKKSSLSGHLPYDFAVFEIDENNLPVVLKHVKPAAIVGLNLFRDQLDRYGEVNTIAKKWHTSLEKIDKTTLILNSDDPLIRYLGYKSKHEAYFFDVSLSNYRKEKLSHDVDSIFCPVSGDPLSFSSISYSHLGKYTCKRCGFTNAECEQIVVKNYPIPGIYNMYNTHAALLCVAKLLDEPSSKLSFLLAGFEPAFGRGESITCREREFIVLLSKNPAGFNQSIERVTSDRDTKNVILILNDRIPDGRDVSWIWDINTEKLIEKDYRLYISGDRALDMAVRVQYSQKELGSHLKIENFDDIEKAIESVIDHTQLHEKIYILPTYSAMLEVRKILTGRKFL